MTAHYDALETREPAAREAELFSRLPEVLRSAMTAPAYAERLRGADPAAVTSRATLAGLHHHPPRRGRIRRAIAVQPIDEAARFMVPADGRPQRDCVLDHAALQARDDVGRLFRRNDALVRHCVLSTPRQWPSDTHASGGVQRMPTRKDLP